jgi:UDP-3-O-[3-hydroxymyristoyl] N-acetylglucosamine deacetylase
MPQQKTLAQATTFEGLGLHYGKSCHLTLSPAPPDYGKQFYRLDQPDQGFIPALAEYSHQTLLSTELRSGAQSVRTVEHLLAALYAFGVDNCRIELDGPEIPILDGSAKPYTEALLKTGLVQQEQAQKAIKIETPLTVSEEDRFVAAFPDSAFRITYGIDFPVPEIGVQWFSLVVTPETFSQEIAPARTFTLLEQIEVLREKGLIQGGSLDCALVCSKTGWVNTPQWPDEPVRHKILDLLGDLSLVGFPVVGHFVAYKAGHDLHRRMSQKLRE